MSHQDKGHFAAKHEGRQLIPYIADEIKLNSDNSGITCSAAHKVSKELNVSPLEIGIQIDLLELRIIDCQLGLFGYANEKKRINPEIEISPDLNIRLEKAVVDGRISCRACWDIAKDLKIKRLDIGSSCEKKNIRIKPCQLGSF